MSELLLQTIIEKLQALEIALLSQGKPDVDQTIKAIPGQIKQLRSEIEDLSSGLAFFKDKSNELMKRLDACTFTLNQPLKNNVEHRHHLHKGIWISAGLAIAAIFLTSGWISSYQSKRNFEANDIKYRALKVTGNKALLKLLFETDSLYSVETDNFRKYVLEQEERTIKQVKLMSVAGEKEIRETRLRIQKNKTRVKK